MLHTDATNPVDRKDQKIVRGPSPAGTILSVDIEALVAGGWQIAICISDPVNHRVEHFGEPSYPTIAAACAAAATIDPDAYILDAEDDAKDDDEDDDREPPEPDGECFRGGEAAAYEREQQAAAQRLK